MERSPWLHGIEEIRLNGQPKPVETTNEQIIHLICQTHLHAAQQHPPVAPVRAPWMRTCAPSKPGLQVSIAHRHEQFKVDGPRPWPCGRWRFCRRSTNAPTARLAPDMVQLMLVGDSGGRRGRPARLANPPRRPEGPHPGAGGVSGEHRHTRHHLRDRPRGHGQDLPGRGLCGRRTRTRQCAAHCAHAPGGGSGPSVWAFCRATCPQKVDPYLRPLYDALYDLMGYDKVQKAFERNAIEIAPLAFMRGAR